MKKKERPNHCLQGASARSAPLATLLSPLAPVTLNVIFREIQTFAVALDIYRSVPSIYTDYYGYDDRAHHHGPLSDEALAALRSIDACIRELDQVRRQFRHRRSPAICSSFPIMG
ncbi:hypothetical protein [Candidatus Amarolinea dominans]|uniref:hypothetical protein n=1 Tax=Candidatus Amarolinea dominans TaxID=3140696 RepID=UPI0031352ADF|nr:hypothetical protein [Anaerolineae bacterium]